MILWQSFPDLTPYYGKWIKRGTVSWTLLIVSVHQPISSMHENQSLPQRRFVAGKVGVSRRFTFLEQYLLALNSTV
jgi:hypothetical protein